MPFLIRYAELFHKSNIIEQIIPRILTNGQDLQQYYPDLLMKGSSQVGPDMEVSKEDEYEQADVDAFNQVKSPTTEIYLGYKYTDV